MERNSPIAMLILLRNGKGGFKESQGSPFPCNDFPFFLAVRDLNRDGNPDLVVANSPSNSAGGTGRDGLTKLAAKTGGAALFDVMHGAAM